MTPEERIAALEQNVADLAEMVSGLCWGLSGSRSVRTDESYHDMAYRVHREAASQLTAQLIAPKPPEKMKIDLLTRIPKTGRKIR